MTLGAADAPERSQALRLGPSPRTKPALYTSVIRLISYIDGHEFWACVNLVLHSTP
jgi:hypothetical protein